jgi:HAD superfamily hydrolase (TIGR01509 family)
MIRAVVFDFDGLILDTEGPVYTAWAEAFDAYGCAPLTLDDWAAEIGTSGEVDTIGLIQARATLPLDLDEMHERRRARRDALLAQEAARPGVHAWLDAADALGLAVAIASSSPPEWVHTHLDRLELRTRFAHLSCFEVGLNAKPAPDLYLAACRALGVAPNEAIAVEDSPNGVTAAKRAGLFCVAVPNPITAQLDTSHADLELQSLEEVSLPDLVARLASRD